MASDKSNGHMTPPQRDVITQPDRMLPGPTTHRLWWIWLVVGVFVLGIGGWAVYAHMHATAQDASASASGGAAAGGKGKMGGPVPVVASRARKGSMDIYLDGLGAVTPLNAASIHSRVDGQLLNVFYKEGQIVKKDDLLVEIDPRPFQASLDQHQGQLQRDEALLRDAQANLDRYKQLLKQSLSITQAQVDTQQALVDQYIGAQKTDQAVIAADQLNLQYCEIKAPFAGRIGLRLVDPGNIVHASDANALAVITQIQPIAVIFTIAEDNIPKIINKLDPEHPLTVEAWDRDIKNKLATGRLLAIDNQVDASTGTLRLKAEFDDEHNELFPNEFVNARLRIDTLKNVVIVPSAAIQRGPDSAYAYVVQGDKVDIQTVTVGPTEGDFTVIKTGVTPDQLVVTDGVDKLQKGTQVTLRERGKGRNGAGTQASAAKAGATQESASNEGSSAADAPIGSNGHRSGGGAKAAPATQGARPTSGAAE